MKNHSFQIKSGFLIIFYELVRKLRGQYAGTAPLVFAQNHLKIATPSGMGTALVF